MQTKLLTIPDFARTCGITYSLAAQMVESGQIPTITVGKRRRIDQRFVDQWLSRGGVHYETLANCSG